jgi:hypothetical protein
MEEISRTIQEEDEDKVMETEWAKEIVRLRAEVKNLKCCGNCLHYLGHGDCPLDHPCPACVCDKWQWDGWAYEKREKA